MFVYLSCHSYYSFLRGTASPAGLAQRAAELGIETLGLTDTDGVYGAVEFFQACRQAGIRPILGVELVGEGRGAVFLARNRRGWERICRLTTARQLEDNFSLSRACREAGTDCYLLTSSPELLDPRPENGYLALRPGMSQTARRRIGTAARELKLPLAVLGEVFFPRPEDRFLAEILAGARLNKSRAELLPKELPPVTSWMQPPARVEKELEEWPTALSATARIAADCRYAPELGRLQLPRFPLSGNRAGRLLRLCRRGIKRHYRKSSSRIERRLRKELSLIFRLGLADYFLLVEDIVGFARRRGISTLGRGSAANSLVCYLLGITDVDPIRYDLYFERFLNPGRSDPPDIDLDFPTARRPEILEYIRRRFGEDRTAMLSTTVRFRGRSAVRAAARFLGMSPAEAGRLTRNLPYFASLRNGERIRREFPECRNLPWEKKWFRRLLETGACLEGIPRHLSVHTGGVVLAPGPLTEYLALERSAGGIVVTQPDMYAVKELGLLKLDILGQRSLAVVDDLLEGLEMEGTPLDFSRFDPSRDPATRDLVASGRTIGCFYIESPVMRQLLRRLNCRDFETLVAASSIIRPGVSSTGCAERYINRRLGRETVPAIHHRVDRVLASTHGVIIYQEQVMRLVTEAAGMSAAEADEFRRTMSKKPGWKSIENYRRKFLRGSRSGGIPTETADDLWRQIRGFAAYAFCQAHSASFAILSFRAAYLKAHRPAEFMAAVLSNRGGFYSSREYLREARRLGLEIRLPDINRSDYRYRGEKNGIRMGLMTVKRLSGATAARILAGRRLRPYRGWNDFIDRVRPGRGELRSLIGSGALDCLGETRSALLWKESVYSSPAEPGSLFSSLPEIPSPSVPPLSPSSRQSKEVESLGFSARPPLSDPGQRPPELSGPLIRAREQIHWAGKTVQLIGEPVTGRLTRTGRSGRLMKFLTLEDETGLFEVVFFPDCYDRFGHHLQSPGPYYIRGPVQLRDTVPTIICTFLASLSGEGGK